VQLYNILTITLSARLERDGAAWKGNIVHNYCVICSTATTRLTTGNVYLDEVAASISYYKERCMASYLLSIIESFRNLFVMAPIGSPMQPTDNPLCHTEYFVSKLTTYSAEQKPRFALDHEAILSLLKQELHGLITRIDKEDDSISKATPDQYLSAMESAHESTEALSSLIDTIERTDFKMDLAEELNKLAEYRDSLAEYADDFDLALHRLPKNEELTRLMLSI